MSSMTLVEVDAETELLKENLFIGMSTYAFLLVLSSIE